MLKALDGVKWLRWIDRLGRYIIGVIFLYAAVPKLLNVNDFAKIIGAYELLPEFMLLPVAVILPVVEIILAVGVILNFKKGKIGSVLLLLVFVAILSYAIYLGLDIDCGCFGPEDPEHTAFHGLRTALGRDVVMLIVLGFSLWFCRKQDLVINN